MKLVTIRFSKMETEKDFFESMILDLQGMEDDLVANSAPVEAIRHMQEAIRVCKEHSKRKFGD